MAIKIAEIQKARGPNRDTLPTPNHFHLSLSHSQISSIILKLE